MKGRKREEDRAKKSRLIVLFRGSWAKCLWVTSQAENCGRHAATLNIVFSSDLRAALWRWKSET